MNHARGRLSNNNGCKLEGLVVLPLGLKLTVGRVASDRRVDEKTSFNADGECHELQR